MPVTKITIGFIEPTSDDTLKNNLLSQMSVQRQAAEVIRDGNGKVIAVNVNLPDESAPEAAAKINGNNGIATTSFVGNEPTYIEWDGTDASLTTYLGLSGTSQSLNASPAALIQTDNGDGTYSVDCPAGNTVGNWQVFQLGHVLPHPNGSIMEARFKFNSFHPSPTSARASFKIRMHNGGFSAVMYAWNVDLNLNPGSIADIQVIQDTNFHVLKIVMDGRTAKYFLDGVETKSIRPALGSSTSIAEFELSSVNTDPASPVEGIDIDYVKYTEMV